MEKYIEIDCKNFILLLEQGDTYINYEHDKLTLTREQLKKIIEKALNVDYCQRYGVPV